MSVLDKVKFDADGYMEDSNAWTPEIAEAIAKREEVTLTERSWVVINYARNEFKVKGEAPTLRNITKNTDVDTKELYSLFPGGPGKMAAKVAGLHKPTGCI
ncbi:MAG: DsrC family protein [Chloroflexi bacterium]|nr:MAG: DsrC family protein [Chloroflexota bacterium]MBA4375895.1 sulfur relay protein DsrC [Anaerolinea sp.]